MTWLYFVLYYFAATMGGIALVLLALGFGIAAVVLYWACGLNEDDVDDYSADDPYLSAQASEIEQAKYPRSARVRDMYEPRGM
jgi:membrane associated rhomboid family serine protease